jgi:hypothetical protein
MTFLPQSAATASASASPQLARNYYLTRPDVSDTVGHKSTHVTETVYRHVIVPAIRGGATVMDDVFNVDEDDTDEGSEEAGNDLGSGLVLNNRKEIR